MGAAPFAAHAPSEPGPAAARHGRRLRLSSLRCRRHALQVAAQQQRQVPSAGNSGGGGVGSSGDAAAAAPAGSQAAPLSCSRRALGAALGAAAVGGCCSTAAASESAAARPPRTLREYRMVMRATALRGSVPAEWVSDFATAMDGFGVVALQQRPQLVDIYRELKGVKMAGKREKPAPPTTVDVVTLGDAWLERAISEGLIQPIADARQCRWWSLLAPRWQRLVCRDARGLPAAGGEVWAAPYRWGCTLVAFQSDKLLRWGGKPVNDWADLLQPGLRGRVAFIDSPREFVGVALKTLGLPYNASAAEMQRRGVGLAELRGRVQELRKQVLVFSSSDHLRALSSGDATAVVGWSEDLMGNLRASNVVVTAPASGTALWADLWCVPSHAAGGAEDGEPSPLLPAWLELPLQPVRAQRSQGIKGGASPLLLPPAEPAGRARSQRGGSGGAAQEGGSGSTGGGGGASSALEGGVMPSAQVLARSEFLLPLDQPTIELYNAALGRD